MPQTNPALLIIDMQPRFFLREESRIKLPGLLAGINELADFFQASHLPIFHVLTEYQPDGSTGEDGELPELHRSESDIFITKTHHSAFVRTGLEDRL